MEPCGTPENLKVCEKKTMWNQVTYRTESRIAEFINK
jgi:hypothetical protein